MPACSIDSTDNSLNSNRRTEAHYFRSMASHWERLYEDNHLTARIYQERKDLSLEWIEALALPASARILDLGCGAGHTSVALALRGYQVHAVDFEQNMLEMTSRRAKAAGVSLNVLIGDAHELPFADATVDLVLALGVVPWLHSPREALAELRRIIRPGGFLLISSDNCRRMIHWLDPAYNPLLAPLRTKIASALRKRGWMPLRETTPPTMQSPGEFDSWLEWAGFKRLKSASIGFGPFTFCRRTLLPDRIGIGLHRVLQRMAYAGWPLLRESGAHYVVAAINPVSESASASVATPRRTSFRLCHEKAHDVSTPVVVLGANTHGSLGIMRSLGRLGVPVHAVFSPPRGPASFSRYCKSAESWDFAAAGSEDTAAYLLDLAKRIGKRSILMPTWDEMAVFAAQYYDRLATGFIYPLQPPALVQSLCNKKQMTELARRLGVPTPEVAFPKSLQDVIQYIETACFPVMVKGIDGNLLKSRTGKKMAIVYSPRQLREMYTAMENADQPNLMLQEFIPGGDDSIWMFNGYFNSDSECLAGFTGRKLRQTPIHTGMTSLGICLQNEVVEQTTRRFMRNLGYRGILDIGYRYDARDGQYKVLDVNPRIGATFRLFLAANGMDVARAMYLDLTAQEVPVSCQREGRKWFVESDLKSCLDYHREGTLTLRQWLQSLRGIEEAGYFAPDDLAPFARLCATALSVLLKQSWQRVKRFIPVSPQPPVTSSKTAAHLSEP